MTSAEGRARLVSEAKPLLTRLQTPLLYNHAVGAASCGSKWFFSTRSGTSVRFVSRCTSGAGESAATGPPYCVRSADAAAQTGTGGKIAARSLADQLGGSAGGAEPLPGVRAAGEPVPAYPVLLERLRGSEDEEMLREAAGELMHQPFDEAVIDEEFEGAIQRCRWAEYKRDFATLWPR